MTETVALVDVRRARRGQFEVAQHRGSRAVDEVRVGAKVPAHFRVITVEGRPELIAAVRLQRSVGGIPVHARRGTALGHPDAVLHERAACAARAGLDRVAEVAIQHQRLIGVRAGAVEDVVLHADVFVPVIVIGLQPQRVTPAGGRWCKTCVVPNIDAVAAAVGLETRSAGGGVRDVLIEDVVAGDIAQIRPVAGDREGAAGVVAVHLIVPNDHAVELDARVHAVVESVIRVVTRIAVDQARIDADERIAVIVAVAGHGAERIANHGDIRDLVHPVAAAGAGRTVGDDVVQQGDVVDGAIASRQHRVLRGAGAVNGVVLDQHVMRGGCGNADGIHARRCVTDRKALQHHVTRCRGGAGRAAAWDQPDTDQAAPLHGAYARAVDHARPWRIVTRDGHRCGRGSREWDAQVPTSAVTTVRAGTEVERIARRHVVAAAVGIATGAVPVAIRAAGVGRGRSAIGGVGLGGINVERGAVRGASNTENHCIHSKDEKGSVRRERRLRGRTTSEYKASDVW